MLKKIEKLLLSATGLHLLELGLQKLLELVRKQKPAA